MEGCHLDATTKREWLLEKLNNRNKERQNFNDAKSEKRNKENLELEDADYFSHAFAEHVKDIQKTLSKIQPHNPDLIKEFATINGNILELQRYLSNSTIFLSDYKIKACQQILNDLIQENEDVRQKLMPKKKFGFNTKKIIPQKLNSNQTGIDKIDMSEKPTIPQSAFTWTLANRQHEHLILIGEEVDGKDITISNIKDCLVEIQGHAGSVQICKMDNCTLLSGPISRSLFAENCKNSTITVASQQVRLHSSLNCKLWLHVTGRAIMEDSNKIEIGEYNYDYSGIEIDFKKAGIDRTTNNYTDIADFNWLSPDIPSPNWKLLNSATQNVDWETIRQRFKDNNKTLL